jgi:alkylated DNA nucleotide flippase Atl1
MRAHEVSFLDLVQGEKQFQVPLYQRTYAWKIKQLEQLWRDLLDQAEALANPKGRSGHFIGSIVLAPSPSLSAGGVQRWLVVDGQQRLTTLMLALTAIKDHVRESEPATADRIQRQYLVNEFRTGDEHLRLLPTQADREVFRSLVLGSGQDIGLTGDGIAEAYQFFRSALVRADDPEDPEDINRIEQVIRSGLSIVEITADRDDNVFRIFESLNNTGLTLSQADLLRNYLFMRLPTRGEDVYRDLWMPLQNRLSSNELELLVWLDLVIRGNETVKQSDIYRAQQTRLEDGASDDEEAVVRFVAELGRRARHLERVLHPEKEPDVHIRSGLERLSDWGAQTSYPLVLHLLDLLEREVIDAGQVADALRYIESYLVRRMACQVPSNNLNRVFNASPPAIGEAADAGAAVQRYLSGRRRYWPSDAELRRSVRARPFYWTGRWSQRFFVLRRLEESYGAAEPVDFAKAQLTIEHVLPQTATDEWLALLAEEVTDEGGPQQLHDLLVHTLGNLTLTAENSRLSNNPFQRKQDIFSASSLQMNKEIADVSGWGRAQILERADRLADRMVELWPGPIDRSAEPADEGRDWSLLRRACSVIPAGAWTTYGDIAELIGSHPVPVGVQLATQPILNAWRVLSAEGRVSPQFRWSDPERTDDPVEVLSHEGVGFIGNRADPAQRLTARELADLLGMNRVDVPIQSVADDPLSDGPGRRFLEQLSEARPDVTGGVLDVLARWQVAGGHLAFGRANETSCSLTIEAQGRLVGETWAMTIYPRYGSVEVAFQHMRRRPVFEDRKLREEFRDRLAKANVTIPDAKLILRPSFPLAALADEASRAGVMEALDWFASTFRAAAKVDAL